MCARTVNQRARVTARGKERRLMREDIATPGCVDVGDARGDVREKAQEFIQQWRRKSRSC